MTFIFLMTYFSVSTQPFAVMIIDWNLAFLNTGPPPKSPHPGISLSSYRVYSLVIPPSQLFLDLMVKIFQSVGSSTLFLFTGSLLSLLFLLINFDSLVHFPNPALTYTLSSFSPPVLWSFTTRHDLPIAFDSADHGAKQFYLLCVHSQSAKRIIRKLIQSGRPYQSTIHNPYRLP